MDRDGVGLCLSGGGYRAMLFHTGVLWRLNELAMLPRLRLVSSVSSGAIAAGTLAHAWDALDFDDGVATGFSEWVVRPLRELASTTIDVPVILRGLLKPWRTIGQELAAEFGRDLFGDYRLPLLPRLPVFDFNATNLRNGERWLFSREWMGDETFGWVADPATRLATAVAASAAFPPFLSPLGLRVPDRAARVPLTDGGVYDNLSVEPVISRCSTVLVSDGGMRLGDTTGVSRAWLRQTARVLMVIDSRVRRLRKHQLLESYREDDFAGAYWGTYSDIANYDVPDALPAPAELTLPLAQLPSRLAALPEIVQQRLINWGYAITDAGMRTFVTPDAAPPPGFPYPDAGVG